MKSFTDWMNEGTVRDSEESGFKITKKLKLADGTELSIQASDGYYCSPRMWCKSYSEYNQFEIGFPTNAILQIMPYIDGYDDTDPTDTVYGYVPKEIIEAVIEERGGVVGFRDDVQ